MNTTDLVDEEIILVDGASSNDEIIKRRWVRNFQRSSNFVWNDRPWAFKLSNITYTYTPGVANPLPDGFGSFEAQGAGIYCRNPRAWLKPMQPGELMMLQFGTTTQTQAVGPWTRWTLGQFEDEESIRFWYEPQDATDVDMVYLRRSPLCFYDGIGTGTDEIGWIPDRWAELIKFGAEWMNAHDVGSDQEETEQAFLKAGLQQMREREGQIANYNMVVPFRRNRMRG